MQNKIHEIEWEAAQTASTKLDRYIQQQTAKSGKLYAPTQKHIQDLYKSDLSRCIDEATLLGDSDAVDVLLQLVLGRSAQSKSELPDTRTSMSKSQVMGIYRTAVSGLAPRDYMSAGSKICIALLKQWFTISYQSNRMYAGSTFRYNMGLMPKFFFAFVMTFGQFYERNQVAAFRKELLDWAGCVAAGSDARSVPPSVYNVYSTLGMMPDLTSTGVTIWCDLYDTTLRIVFDQVDACYALSMNQLLEWSHIMQHDFILSYTSGKGRKLQSELYKEAAK